MIAESKLPIKIACETLNFNRIGYYRNWDMQPTKTDIGGIA